MLLLLSLLLLLLLKFWLVSLKPSWSSSPLREQETRPTPYCFLALILPRVWGHSLQLRLLPEALQHPDSRPARRKVSKARERPQNTPIEAYSSVLPSRRTPRNLPGEQPRNVVAERRHIVCVLCRTSSAQLGGSGDAPLPSLGPRPGRAVQHKGTPLFTCQRSRRRIVHGHSSVKTSRRSLRSPPPALLPLMPGAHPGIPSFSRPLAWPAGSRDPAVRAGPFGTGCSRRRGGRVVVLLDPPVGFWFSFVVLVLLFGSSSRGASRFRSGGICFCCRCCCCPEAIAAAASALGRLDLKNHAKKRIGRLACPPFP